MNHLTPSAPPPSVSRASSLGAPALRPSLHRESSETSGDRQRRRGCENCGNCRCGNEATSPDDSHPHSPSPASSSGIIGWLADRPWLFVVGAFALLIGVWTTFITLALRNPPRDVLKNPLPTPADVRPGH
ncbi:MAG: hypothetical protein ACKV19_10590 [Verrucomicrobiales bacterium]